jgi:effector-binding domain-containing protein
VRLAAPPVAAAVTVEPARAELIAAVRAIVPIGRVADAWRPALDRVWAFLRTRPDLRGGHNLFLYHHPARRDDPMAVDFGVQVAQHFEPVGDVRCVATPAGEVARAVHVGPYDRLRETHDAIHAWCAANGRAIGGASWEVYGDWTDDPAKLETTINYLLS